MFGFNGSDHFKAQDGSIDAVYGGTDIGFDVVDDKDAFDNIFEVP
jgi:hypothetical protein